MNIRWLLFGCVMLVPAARAEISGGEAAPQVRQVTAMDLGMERYAIARPDSMLWIFNGRGKCFPRRWSVTGFNGLDGLDGPWNYNFHFDFVEKRSGVHIIDNAYDFLNGGPDLCGFNFRAGEPFCIVPQDNTWYPYYERRTGTFCKDFKTGTVSFGIETRTLVSARSNAVLLVITITNRTDAPLPLTLLPVQNGHNSLQSLASDIKTVNGQGLEWTIPAHTSQTHHFAVIAGLNPTLSGKQPVQSFESNLVQMVEQADADGEAMIQRVAGHLPSLKTSNKNLDILYKRCITSFALCRWNYPQARTSPIWWSWSSPLITAWDFSFTADTLSLVDPSAVRVTAVGDVLGIGKMQASYINPNAPQAESGILYIQDPFALQELIKSYSIITGDRTILDDVVGEHSVYDWLKLWAAKLDSYPQKDGLIDLNNDGNELLLELRTDGYDHVAPDVNGLAVSYFRWLAKVAEKRHDPDAAKYAKRAAELDKALQSLWDEKAGWFDNLYDDGTRQPFYTMHLFDLLGTDVLTPHEKERIASHFVEGEFLAPMGIYSISKKDTVHWDRFDADWGGGGCYIGTPLRTARYLYENGDAQHGWEVIKRIARLGEHFSYLPQSPLVDEPYEWRGGGNINISAGAGIEAVWSGIFGLRPQPDGSLLVSPAPFNPEIGEATMTDFQFRQHSYAVKLLSFEWQVFLDGKLWSKNKYGKSVIIPLQPPRYRITASSSFYTQWGPAMALDDSADPNRAWISKQYGGGTKDKPLDTWWQIEFFKNSVTLKGVKIFGDHRDVIPLQKNLLVQAREDGIWKTVGELKDATNKDATVTFSGPVTTDGIRVFVPAADLPKSENAQVDGIVRICELKFILSDGTVNGIASLCYH